jgi:hypothetical protein
MSLFDLAYDDGFSSSPPPPPPPSLDASSQNIGPPIVFSPSTSRAHLKAQSPTPCTSMMQKPELVPNFHHSIETGGEWEQAMDEEMEQALAALEMNSEPSNVLERSQRMIERKQSKVEAVRRLQEEEELRSLRPQPSLSKRPQGLPQRSLQDMLDWEQQRRAKVEAKTRLKEAMTQASVTGRPVITRKAQQLATKWRREGSEDSVSVASGSTGTGTQDYRSVASSSKSAQERLYDYDEVRRHRLQQLQELQEQAAREAAKPKIDERSARLVRRQEGQLEAHERLYSYSLAAPSGCSDDPVHMAQHDERTGQRLFEVSSAPLPVARCAYLRRDAMRCDAMRCAAKAEQDLGAAGAEGAATAAVRRRLGGRAATVQRPAVPAQARGEGAAASGARGQAARHAEDERHERAHREREGERARRELEPAPAAAHRRAEVAHARSPAQRAAQLQAQDQRQ